MSTNKFDLYSNDPLCDEANDALDVAVELAWTDIDRGLAEIDNKHGTPSDSQAAKIVWEAFKTHVRPIMEKYVKVGACDTEPRVTASNILVKRSHKKFGTSKYLDF